MLFYLIVITKKVLRKLTLGYRGISVTVKEKFPIGKSNYLDS